MDVEAVAKEAYLGAMRAAGGMHDDGFKYGHNQAVIYTATKPAEERSRGLFW
jgi:hypothetical protein